MHPAEARPRGGEIAYGVDALPDVVLEVDYSTDVRRRKLSIYQSWGFPEVWVEVPDASWHHRPKSRRSALTINVLEGGRYIEAASSRAFPGWTAAEIHRALNEPEASLETVDVLRRVGAALGAAEGTSAADDRFLSRELAEERDRARAKGRAEGRAEAQLEMLRLAVPRTLAARGLRLTPELHDWLNEASQVEDVPGLIEVAGECRDVADFLGRARGLR